MFADVEHACARLGIDPGPKELWEIAAAFGLHRPGGPGTPGAPNVNDPVIQEMIRAQKAADEGGPEPQWSQPIPADRT